MGTCCSASSLPDQSEGTRGQRDIGNSNVTRVPIQSASDTRDLASASAPPLPPPPETDGVSVDGATVDDEAGGPSEAAQSESSPLPRCAVETTDASSTSAVVAGASANSSDAAAATGKGSKDGPIMTRAREPVALAAVDADEHTGDAAGITTPLHETDTPPPPTVYGLPARQLTFAGSSFTSACLHVRAEEPARTRAAIALCALAPTAHLEPGTRAEDGGVVPPPLVGCLMWLLRHNEAEDSSWAEHDVMLAVTPQSTLFAVTSTWQRTRPACCLAQLQRAIRTVHGGGDDWGVVELTLTCTRPPAAAADADGLTPTTSTVCVRVWKQPAAPGDSDAAAVGFPSVAAPLPPGARVVDFGGFLRLAAAEASDGSRSRFIDARVGEETVDGSSSSTASWERLLEMAERAPDDDDGFGYHPAARPRFGFKGARRDAIRALDDLASALGFEHQCGASRRSLRRLHRDPNAADGPQQQQQQRPQQLTLAYVTSSRAAEFLRHLGDDAPFTLSDLALLRGSLTPVGSPVTPHGRRWRSSGGHTDDAWDDSDPRPTAAQWRPRRGQTGRQVFAIDDDDDDESTTRSDSDSGDAHWSF